MAVRWRFETTCGTGYRAWDLAARRWLVHGDVIETDGEPRVSIGPRDRLVPLDPPDCSAAAEVREPEPPEAPHAGPPAPSDEPAAPLPAPSPLPEPEAPKRPRRRRR